jgi:hypothetical protein
MTTYNTDLQLPIGHVPKEDYMDEMLDVHNALELLAQAVYKHIVTIDADYTATLDDYTILLDTSSNTVAVTLPDAADVPFGKRYELKTLDVSFTGSVVSDSIDESASPVSITYPDSITVVSDNTGWWII